MRIPLAKNVGAGPRACPTRATTGGCPYGIIRTLKCNGYKSLLFILSLFSTVAMAEDNVVNVSAWSQELSPSVVQQFQQDTGIKVNFSTFDSNEVLYAKMKASSKDTQYDVVEPSSYYITRMAREDMIEKIDLNRLSNYKNLNPAFTHPDYDPKGEYSIPWVWGLTGIVVNRKYYPNDKIEKWTDLWAPKYRDSLLLLNDPREVFNVGLMTLGYSPNENNLQHLQDAYQNLVALLPNVRLYNSSSVPSLLVDEDVTIGMAWNADAYKASLQNPDIEFIYPKDKFVIWVDSFVIPKNAPHRDNAYKFLNYVMQAKIAALQVTETFYPTANQAALAYLPPALANNAVIFPGPKVITQAYFQTDISDYALDAISRYWQLLKLQ